MYFPVDRKTKTQTPNQKPKTNNGIQKPNKKQKPKTELKTEKLNGFSSVFSKTGPDRTEQTLIFLLFGPYVFYTFIFQVEGGTRNQKSETKNKAPKTEP